MSADDDSVLGSIMAAGAAANERFVRDSIALDKAWRDGKLHEQIAKMRQEALDGDSDGPGSDGTAGNSDNSAG